VTLTNRGTSTLLGVAAAVTGNFARSGAGAGSCGTTLAVGASCNVYVTFRPTAAGARTGTLTITSSDPTNPTLTVALTGWGNYSAATGVTLTASPATAATAGSIVTFTAAGSGAGAGAAYTYRFWLSDGASTTLMQDYSAIATFTWPIPLGQPPRGYTVTVDVRTNPSVALDATRSLAYRVDPVPPATSATLVASPVSPSAAGTSVTFTAAGAGSAAPMSYQFWLFSGGAWSMVQDWSSTSSWTLAAPVAGSYQVEVWVRTSPWVGSDVITRVTQTVN
jgi:hypothetical protein